MCSDEFAPLARAESIARGCPAMPLVALPHPVAGNRADLVRQKAEAIADEVLSVLTDPADALAQRYEGRFAKPAERRLSPDAVCIEAVCAVDPPRSR